MLLRNEYKFGDLRAVVYDFEEIDDVLPLHNHKFGGAHISIVARGSFVAKGAGWEKQLPLGSLVDWDPDQWHEFIALEGNSRLINITK